MKKHTKRDDILATAIRLFSRHGARRITVEELCREAGASKMTFYRNFDNKRALVEAIRDQFADEAFAAFDAIDAQDLPFPQKIDLMTRWKAEHAARLRLDFIQEMVSTEAIHTAFERRFLANLRKARDRGEIRPDVNLEFHCLLVRKCGELFQEGEWQTILPDASTFTRQLRTILWYGLLPRDET